MYGVRIHTEGSNNPGEWTLPNATCWGEAFTASLDIVSALLIGDDIKHESEIEVIEIYFEAN